MEKLRKVNSTVHLTGVQTDDTKAALTGLLQPLEKNVRYSERAES